MIAWYKILKTEGEDDKCLLNIRSRSLNFKEADLENRRFHRYILKALHPREDIWYWYRYYCRYCYRCCHCSRPSCNCDFLMVVIFVIVGISSAVDSVL